MSPRIRRDSGIFRRKSGEAPPPSLRASSDNHIDFTSRAMDCFVASLLATAERIIARRHNRPLDLAKADAVAIALAPAAHDQQIAVFEKRRLTCRRPARPARCRSS